VTASPSSGRPSFLLLTYDSCRLDAMRAARTPVLDSFAPVLLAQAPGNFTYASHQAMFVGLLPNAIDDVAGYNRFTHQLLGLGGEVGETNVARHAVVRVESTWNLVAGLCASGYRTVGAGAMTWFHQASLTHGFEEFAFTGTDADRQVEYVLEHISSSQPFFAFINFGETHAPFDHAGKIGRCPVDVRARLMQWPPRQGDGPVGVDNPAFSHQVESVEFLDRRLGRLLSALPANTVVIVCADHGECLGEDGYWGHGVNHPMVLDVPLAIFRVDGRELTCGW
jgi:membrane-anchored protein YejM (alkaline phosphatase superfamily)